MTPPGTAHTQAKVNNPSEECRPGPFCISLILQPNPSHHPTYPPKQSQLKLGTQKSCLSLKRSLRLPNDLLIYVRKDWLREGRLWVQDH